MTLTRRTLTALCSLAELRSLDPEDPFLRWEIPDSFTGPGYAFGDAVIIPRDTQTRGPGMAVFGPADDVGGLLDELIMTGRLDEFPRNIITIDASCYDAVASRLDLHPGGDWSWMWTTAVPPEIATQDKIIELGEPDFAELTDFLAEHNPGSDGVPGRFPGQHWLGVRDPGGTLVACGVAEPSSAGYPLLSGITTHAEQRGRGHGRLVTAALTQWAIARHGICTLGVYADNAAALRLYESLGFRIGRHWRSRRLLANR